MIDLDKVTCTNESAAIVWWLIVMPECLIAQVSTFAGIDSDADDDWKEGFTFFWKDSFVP